jgi:hypothetical protein
LALTFGTRTTNPVLRWFLHVPLEQLDVWFGILHIMKVNDEPSDLCARALATVVGNQDPEQLALKMYVVVRTYSRVALQSHCWEAKWNNVQHGVNLLLTGVVYQASNLWFSRVVCCASANRSKNKTSNHNNESFAGQSSNQLISQPKKQANQKKAQTEKQTEKYSSTKRSGCV